MTALRLVGVAHHSIHPHLPRAPGGEAPNPICLAAYAEDEIALACGCAISLVHVF